MSLDWSQCPAVESIPGKVSGAWVPFRIVLALGPIPLMKPEMISGMAEAFQKKQDKLERTRNHWL